MDRFLIRSTQQPASSADDQPPKEKKKKIINRQYHESYISYVYRCALRFWLGLWCALGKKSLKTTDLDTPTTKPLNGPRAPSHDVPSSLCLRWARGVLLAAEGVGGGDVRGVPAASLPAGPQHGLQQHPVLPEPPEPGLEGPIHQGLHLAGRPLGRGYQDPPGPGLRWESRRPRALSHALSLTCTGRLCVDHLRHSKVTYNKFIVTSTEQGR